MSYRIEQKNGNRIYVYEATNHWDPVKKRPQQKRVYLGVKDPKTGEIRTPRRDRWSNRQTFSSGVVHAVDCCTRENQLRDILNQVFGSEDGEKIFALASYCATEGTPMYLFENWALQTDGMSSQAMTSQSISDFLHRIGKGEKSRAKFWQKWAAVHGKNRNLIYDLTSISTYSKGLEFAEWGYNRDGESLPQVNVGMLYSDRPGMPLGYKVYPGSIGDISTMKNLIHYVKHDLLQTIARFVLDRGFFSSRNISMLDDAGFDYLIPVPAGLNLAKDILRETENSFQDESQFFEFNGRLMAHAKVAVDYAGMCRIFHVFQDFNRRNSEMQILLEKLMTVEERFKKQNFDKAEDAQDFVESVSRGMSKLFVFKKSSKRYTLHRNAEMIHAYAMKFGKLILLPKNFSTEPVALLTDYFRRDGVEKFFDTLKNEMDSKRGRVQSQETFDGRLFIHTIGLIIYGEMQRRIKQNAKALKCKMSFPEIISNLKRLKRLYANDGSSTLGEMTARQKTIFQLLEIPLPE